MEILLNILQFSQDLRICFVVFVHKIAENWKK